MISWASTLIGCYSRCMGVPAGNEWYSHVPNVVTERDDGKVTIYWDKPIKTDRKVSYNRPDVVVIDSEENTEQGTVPAKLSESLEKLEIEDMIGRFANCCINIHYSYT